MVTRLALLLIIVQLQQAANSPLRTKRSPRELQPHQQLLISRHPVLQHNIFTSKRGSIPLIAPIPLSQLYIHPNIHVIPSHSNLLHNSVQHIVTKDNVKIPIITQTVPQNSSYAHPTLLPILIPIHNIVSTGNRLISVHQLQDLSVIPLQRNKIEKVASYKVAMEKKDDEIEETSNQYRNFYGGYGNGLFFGGHGSGHGFYAYGK